MNSACVYIVTDLLKAVLGKVAINMQAKVEEKCSLCGQCHTTVEIFLCGLRHATVEELCFLRGPCRIYITGVCL
jgi:hypothetical protein